MKRFYVFLDESGDFDRDLEKKGRKACLVGGLLVEKAKMNQEYAKNLICNNWLKFHPDEKNVFKSARHATDMEDYDKGYCIFGALKKAHQSGYSFVLFENDVRARIVNSSVTYIYVLAEGAVQLLNTLIKKYREPVELNLVIGMRKDTSIPVKPGMLEGYIDKEEYKTRLEERIVVEQVKVRSTLMKQSNIHIELDDDKKNPYLVLCDYVCYSRFRRQAPCFDIMLNGVTLRRLIRELYNQDEFVFPLFCTEENSRFNHYITRGNYASAFMDICIGDCGETNFNYVLNHASDLEYRVLYNHLNSLSAMLNDIIHVERNLNWGLEILDEAERLSQCLKKNGCDTVVFELDLYLYRLAVCNHKGDLLQMEVCFEKAEPLLSHVLNKIENLEYYFIFFNRKAVYFRDVFQYQESMEICRNLVDKLGYYEMLLSELKLLKIPNNPMKSYQLGSVLGTHVQTMMAMVRQDKTYLDEARQISDQAMEAFDQQQDLSRQYQIRAQIECEAHCFSEALKWLNRSLGGDSWKSIFHGNTEINRFSWYHLSRIMAELSRELFKGAVIEDGEKITDQMLESSLNYVGQLGMEDFPVPIILKNIGLTVFYRKGNLSQSLKYMKQALTACTYIGSVSMQAIELGIYADAMMMLYDSEQKEQKEIYEAFCVSYKEFMNGELPEGMREFFISWEKVCTGCCQDISAEVWEMLGRSIVY